MSEVAFYHLTRRSLEAVLPELLAKVLERGERAVVLCGSAERAASLDTLLWTYAKESFLPHATRAGGHEAEQPVYLTEHEENPNQAGVLILVDGGGGEFLSGFARCLDLFDGNDAEAVTLARARWREARAAGHLLTYWQQGERGWEKKTEA